MKKLLLSLFLLLWVVTIVQAGQAVKYSDLSKPVMISANKPEFSLTMKSNPTTGYSWFLVGYNDNIIHPVSHKFVAPKNSMPGAGGYEVWTFRVIDDAFDVPQITRIELVYIRPWLKHITQPTTVQIVVNPVSKT